MDSAQNKYESLKPFPNLYKADGQKLGIGKESAEMIRDAAAELTDKMGYFNQEWGRENKIFPKIYAFLHELDEYGRVWNYTITDQKTKDCTILENALSDLFHYKRIVEDRMNHVKLINDTAIYFDSGI